MTGGHLGSISARLALEHLLVSNAKRSISTFLPKSRGLWTVYVDVTFPRATKKIGLTAAGACFSKVLVTLRVRKAVFFYAVFAFKIKISITYFENETIKLTVIKAKLFRVFELGTVLLLNRFGFKIITFVPERLSGLWKNGLFPARPWQ